MGQSSKNSVLHDLFENFSWYARAAREKYFCTLKPVLTHAHVLIDFDNARKLQARYVIIGHAIFRFHRIFEKCKKNIKLRWQWNSVYMLKLFKANYFTALIIGTVEDPAVILKKRYSLQTCTSQTFKFAVYSTT